MSPSTMPSACAKPPSAVLYFLPGVNATCVYVGTERAQRLPKPLYPRDLTCAPSC